jgi:hypothetical protein
MFALPMFALPLSRFLGCRSKREQSRNTARDRLYATGMYMELQVTTNYSFLRGASHIEELVA